MGYYLIDFENVHDVGLNGVTSLSETDEICIFYSAKSEHMSFETHVNIMKTHAKVKYIKLRKSARNYLDFQLVTHLGYLVGSNAPGPYYIISKDTGYDSAIDYWRDHGVNIIRQPSISYNSRQGRFPGQHQGQLTPAALVIVQESHQVVSENQDATLQQIPLNAGFDTPVQDFSAKESPVKESAAPEPSVSEPSVKTDDKVEEAQAQTTQIIEIPQELFPVFSEEISDTAQADQDDQEKTSEDNVSAGTEASEADAQAPEAKAQDGQSAENAAPSGSEENAQRKNSRRRSKDKKQNNSRSKKAETEPAQPADVPAPAENEAAAVAELDPVAEPADTSGESASSGHSLEFSEDQAASRIESLPENYRKKVRTALRGKEIPSAHYASIYKAILHSYDKLALNNLMVKTFGNSKGGVVYNQIKDIFTDFHQQGQDK